MQLDGKIALVTGGNSGIGLGTARRLIEEGAFVYVTGRRQEALDRAQAALGPSARAIQADVTRKIDMQRVADTIRDEKGRLDIVFANAGNNFVGEGAGIAQSNNLFGIDPLFVNAYDGNFQVKADSPAVNKGVSLAIVTTDFAGVARPQGGAPDIGAYEYNGSSSTPPAAPTSFRIVTQ